jgi:PKD repeat protein
MEWNSRNQDQVSLFLSHPFSPSYTKFCDGTYTLTLTAKNSAFSSYTETYTTTIKVKYDCLYLKNSGIFYTPTGGLVHWYNGSSTGAQTLAMLTYYVNNPLIDVTHPLVHGSASY